MTIIPITDQTPACFGVMCPKHKDCEHWHLVDNAPATQIFIGTCDKHGTGDRPKFLQHQPEEVAA